MSKKTDDQPVASQPQVRRPSRRARLQALLFGGAALGTTALLIVGAKPKVPPTLGD
jgi:hypothetical protein